MIAVYASQPPSPAALRMPAITKALRQPSRVPTRPNRNDSDAPMVV
jgi:hypothetical protein